MATKKHNIVVIAVSGLIAIILLFIPWKSRNPQQYEKKVYRVTGGWGYDILVNKHIFIHQESVPVAATAHAFVTKEEATRIADKVLEKLESGHAPTLTKSDLETILPVTTIENGQYRQDQ